jgi:hypothetical protein
MGYEVPAYGASQTVNVYTGAVAPADEVIGGGVVQVPAHSGGIYLSSGEVVAVVVKALTSNSGDIYIGGATAKPYSGVGYCLEPGEAYNIDVKNLNAVYLCSVVSGDAVTWSATK